jgi:hypothetical protein
MRLDFPNALSAALGGPANMKNIAPPRAKNKNYETNPGSY